MKSENTTALYQHIKRIGLSFAFKKDARVDGAVDPFPFLLFHRFQPVLLKCHIIYANEIVNWYLRKKQVKLYFKLTFTSLQPKLIFLRWRRINCRQFILRVRIICWNVPSSQVLLGHTRNVYQYNSETQTDIVIPGMFGTLVHFKARMNKTPACVQND